MKAADIITPEPLLAPIANQGLRNTLPDNATGTNYASIEEGFPEITMKAPKDGGLPPWGQDFNGMFYLMSSQTCFLQNGGLITFDQAVSDKIDGYPQGAILDYVTPENTYVKVKSLIDDNTYNFVTTPSYIDGEHWEEVTLAATTSWGDITGNIENQTDLQTVLNNQLNKTQITNCILEAPNGVVTYTNSTLTAKQGLKVLMPNGRNADGSLKNIEYTVTEDLTFNMSGFKNLDFILVLTQSNLAIHNPNLLEGLDNNKPVTLQSTAWTTYYATDTNIYYSSVGSTTANWVATPLIVLGVGFSNETNQITSFTPLQPVSLAKEQDIDGRWVYKNLLLCDQQMTTVLNVETDLTFDLSSYLPNDGQRYEIIVNGYIFVGNSTSSSLAVYARNSEGYVNNICAARNQVVTADTNTELALGSALMIIEADRRLTLRYFATGLNGQLRNFNVKGYRKVR